MFPTYHCEGTLEKEGYAFHTKYSKTHLWIDRFNSLQRQNTDEGRTHSSPVLTTSSSIKKSSSNSTTGGEVDRVGHLIENMLNHQVLTPEHEKIVNHIMPGHDP